MRALFSNNFGARETAILEIFWANSSPQTVGDIHEALAERDLAYTTIMNTMVRMTDKGWLHRTTQRPGAEGRRGVVYVYTVRLSKGALLAATIEETCERLGASQQDRTEALALLLGVAVKW